MHAPELNSVCTSQVIYKSATKHQGKIIELLILLAVNGSTESVLQINNTIDALHDARIVLHLRGFKTCFILTCDSLFAIDSERELFSCKQFVQCNNKHIYEHIHVVQNLFPTNRYIILFSRAINCTFIIAGHLI